MNKYTYEITNGIVTSISKETNNTIVANFNLEYQNNKLSNITNNEKVFISFKANINNEISGFYLSDENKTAEIESEYINDLEIKEIYPKISEYNSGNKIRYTQTNDLRNLVNKFPISILREYGLENIHCFGKQAEITSISSNETSMTFNFVDGKIINVYGVTNNKKWKVEYQYNNDKLTNIIEFSMRVNALNKETYMLDSTFELKYLNDKVHYIDCIGTDFSRIELQYNSTGELIAVYKISTNKSLWYTLKNDYLDFINKKIIFQYRSKSLIKTITEGSLEYEYSYDVTKDDVLSYIIPGIITPDKNMFNLAMCFLDISILNKYVKEIKVRYNNIEKYLLTPTYFKKYITNIDIIDIKTMIKVGYIKYIYKKNKIKNISSFYYDSNNNPIKVSELIYETNPYDETDNTIKITYNDSILYTKNESGRIKEVIKNGNVFTKINYNENNEPDDIINNEIEIVSNEVFNSLKINGI